MKRGDHEYSRGMESGSYKYFAGEAGMIKEDRTAMANLPQKEVMRYYPSWRHLDGAYLDDSVRGIDDLNDEAVRRTSESMRRDVY